MASIDAFIFSLLKAKYLGISKAFWIIPLSMLVYSTQPLMFYSSLSIESMTVMNILWNVMSNIIVSLIGIFLFGEVLSINQYVGIIFSLIGITLLGMH
jgi:multidrug transporter EmrE-like cation transporter